MHVEFPIAFNIFSCVHTDYASSSCQTCLDLCREEVFSLQRGKIILNESLCTACGACVGSCPTHALSLSSFESDGFVKSFIGGSSISLSCEEMGVCLNVFSPCDFSSMLLGRGHNISCEMSACENCTINQEGKISKIIEEKVLQTNTLTSMLNEPVIIEIKKDHTPHQRRDFLRKIASVVTTKAVIDVNAEGMVKSALVEAKSAANPPQNLIFLRHVLKERIEDFSTTLLPSQKDFLVAQKIDDRVCTNCQECISSCPTRALSSSGDHEMILFQQGSCVACGVCHEVCPENCISSAQSVDIVDIAFNRAKILATFQIAICQECKTGFVYKGGEQVCSRCLTYRDDFAHMFVSASDLS